MRIALPVLRRAVIPADTYRAQTSGIETVAMQLLLAGPAPRTTRLGDMGPGVFVEGPMPLTDTTVLGIKTALGATPDASVHVPVAAALAPRPVAEESERLAQPGGAVLLVVLLAFGLWCWRLFLREETDESP